MSMGSTWFRAGMLAALFGMNGCYLTHGLDGVGGADDGQASSAAPRGRGGPTRPSTASPGSAGGSPAAALPPPMTTPVPSVVEPASATPPHRMQCGPMRAL